tara:strand:- start:311 stop:913 length:603 start_codon:yes stop_codon:yes gene_type:complete
MFIFGENPDKRNKDFRSSIIIDQVDKETQTNICNQHISININDDKAKNNDCLINCIGYFCIGMCLILLISIVTGFITWLGFSINALSNTSNSDIKDKCEKSNIWALMIIIIITSIMHILSLLFYKNKNDNDNKIIPSVIQVCLQIAISVWLGIELHTNCAKNNLNDEKIYILLLYWFYFSCFSIGVTCIVSLLFWKIYYN